MAETGSNFPSPKDMEFLERLFHDILTRTEEGFDRKSADDLLAFFEHRVPQLIEIIKAQRAQITTLEKICKIPQSISRGFRSKQSHLEWSEP